LDRAIRNLVCNTSSLTYAICGLGESSFHHLRVAVSGLHKTLNTHHLWDEQSIRQNHPPIQMISDHRLVTTGLDYRCRLSNGSRFWIRDIDLWDFIGGPVVCRRYWKSVKGKQIARKTLTLEDLTLLAARPQYRGIDGDFLRDMLAEAERELPHRK
jgi:hypothetical protein